MNSPLSLPLNPFDTVSEEALSDGSSSSVAPTMNPFDTLFEFFDDSVFRMGNITEQENIFGEFLGKIEWASMFVHLQF